MGISRNKGRIKRRKSDCQGGGMPAASGRKKKKRNKQESGTIELIENYVVIDLEMTGLRAKTDRILEVGAARVRNGVVTDTYAAIIRQQEKLPEKIVELTGITDEAAEAGRELDEVMEEFFPFLGEDILVGQNVIFDYSFLKQWAVNHKRCFEREAVDTLKLARKFLPEEEKKDLESLCRYFGILRRNAHRALDDAIETAQLLEKLKETFGEENEEAFTPKPLQYKAKRQSLATPQQIRYLQEFAAYHGIELSRNLGGMTRSEASRLTDQLILRYGKMGKRFKKGESLTSDEAFLK